MVLKADINTCEIIDWQSNAGEYNARVLQVELCEEMSNCEMSFVTFELADGTVYESLIKDGKAEMPMFEKAQFIKIGVYSADIEGDELKKRYSPSPCYDYVNPGSYSANSEEPPLPTPSMMEEILARIDGVVTKENIETEVYVNETYPEGAIYNANAVNEVLLILAENLNTINDKISAIDDDYAQALLLIGGAE